MLDPSKYQSIGEALRDELIQYSNEVCLIETDREREKERLTYRDFKERAHPLAKALQDGRPPEGLHDDARELSGAVRRAHIDLSILAGRTLPQYPANEPCHRFHGGFFRSVYVRCNGRAFAHVASRIRARSFSEIQNHLCESRSTRFEKLTEKLASAL